MNHPFFWHTHQNLGTVLGLSTVQNLGTVWDSSTDQNKVLKLSFVSSLVLTRNASLSISMNIRSLCTSKDGLDTSIISMNTRKSLLRLMLTLCLYSYAYTYACTFVTSEDWALVPRRSSLLMHTCTHIFLLSQHQGTFPQKAL